ncbi:MAG: hypothetical protein ACLFTI_07790 [Anaerolineales bacterium]
MPHPTDATQWTPAHSLRQTLRYALTGRIHFPRERVGETLTMADGRTFTIFRHVVIDAAAGTPPSPTPAGALFQVRFHVAGMSARQNQLFSLLPIPFFVGLPGFCRRATSAPSCGCSTRRAAISRDCIAGPPSPPLSATPTPMRCAL